MNSKTILAVAFVIILGAGFFVYQGVMSSNTSVTNKTQPSSGAANADHSGDSIGNQPTVNLAPDFTLTSLDGNNISLSDYRGDKPVVLDFFATWCPNCQRDMPKLSKIYEEYKDQVEVIGINLKENQSVVRDFIDSRGIDFPIVLDPSSTVSRQYSVRYTNTHVLINKAGEIVKTVPGDLSEADVVALINS